MKGIFLVKMDYPEELEDIDDAINYIKDAIKLWGGQRHPDDLFFAPTGVEVIFLKTEKNK